MGSIPALHYHKYSPKNRGGDWKAVQYYGYTSSGSYRGIHYDETWSEFQYLVSSQETAFEMSLLEKYDV